jgi:hypothetical protein
MDKLEAVRIAARKLDRARDEEFHANQAWQNAKVRLIEADKAYAAALDALHESAVIHFLIALVIIGAVLAPIAGLS